MFWNVTIIYNAFIRTTDHCKVQTTFVSLFYIFINMKPWNASNSSVVVGRPRPLGHLTNFFNFGKFANFFHWGNEFSIYATALSMFRNILFVFSVKCCYVILFFVLVADWFSSNSVAHIKEVILLRAWLVPDGWLFVSLCRIHTILVFNQPPRSTQPGHPFMGRRSEY